MTVYEFSGDIPDNCLINGSIAIDTETMGLNLDHNRLCLVQIADQHGNIYLVKLSKSYNCPNLKALLSNSTTLKLFHFARFDVAVIWKYLGVKIDNIFCTKIASKLVRTYTDHHGLKELCRELLGIQMNKTQQSSYWGAATLTNEQKEYAANDVRYLHQLVLKLTEMLKNENKLDIAYKLFHFLPNIVQLDLLGFANTDIFSH